MSFPCHVTYVLRSCNLTYAQQSRLSANSPKKIPLQIHPQGSPKNLRFHQSRDQEPLLKSTLEAQ
jgi:hypothetical protein